MRRRCHDKPAGVCEEMSLNAYIRRLFEYILRGTRYTKKQYSHGDVSERLKMGLPKTLTRETVCPPVPKTSQIPSVLHNLAGLFLLSISCGLIEPEADAAKSLPSTFFFERESFWLKSKNRQSHEPLSCPYDISKPSDVPLNAVIIVAHQVAVNLMLHSVCCLPVILS